MEKELELHAPYIQKYIVAHDTTICQDRPKDALYRCLSDFCDNNARWKIVERGKTNVGYTISGFSIPVYIIIAIAPGINIIKRGINFKNPLFIS